MSSSCYTAIPDGPRTLLSYIKSFGLNESSQNDGTANWNTGRATLTLTHLNSDTDYFTRYNRVKMMQGDGSSDGLDWAIFNFDKDSNGDYDGYSTTLAYFAGENTASGGTGGLGSDYYGIIWGWNGASWNKLFQMNLPGNGDYSHRYAAWWTSGTTVTSGNGKYAAYDTLSISNIGFSFQKDTSIIPTSLFIQATLTTSQSIIYKKFVSGATIPFNVSSNAGSVPRTYESNNSSIITIPTASTPSASIVAAGKTTIKVTQPKTTLYTEVINNSLIAIIIIGQGQTYTSEDMTSVDLTYTNLSGTTFSDCILTNADLFGATVTASTNFTNSTLLGIKSGRVIGITSLLPSGFKMI
jgi:hypothetical protein